MSSKIFIIYLMTCLYAINKVNGDGWLQKCPHVKPVEYFDIDNLTGLWFYFFSSEANGDTKCNRLICQNNTDYHKITCAFNVWSSQNLYEYGNENDVIYDPAIDASSFTIKSNYTEDVILKKWYGDHKYMVLDYDKENLSYILLYSCKKLYFGIKTKESAFVLTKTNELDVTIQARIRNILNSFSYGGKGLKKVDHFPNVCNIFD